MNPLHETAFHEGEQALQARMGVRDRLAELGPQVVRDYMPDQHRELFEKLPTLLLGALDADGQPWATMLAGPPGFVRTPDARTMAIATAVHGHDPALAVLQREGIGAPVGLLGLEPHTRRRNRMNGRLGVLSAEGLTVDVVQSFGNCPKYIQARDPVEWQAVQPVPAEPLGPALHEAALGLIRSSDTLFIASASAARPGPARSDGVDVSHRGGPVGFVEAEHAQDGATTLVLADYPGNRFFMTLGNLVRHPHAGLLFVDYQTGDLLHLAADAAVEWQGEARWLRLRIRRGLWRPGALAWRWSAARPAPQFMPPAASPG